MSRAYEVHDARDIAEEVLAEARRYHEELLSYHGEIDTRFEALWEWVQEINHVQAKDTQQVKENRA